LSSAGWFSAAIRAEVIIPRSPTMTILASLNLSRTTVTIWVNAVGSPVLPGKTRTATGRRRSPADDDRD
jgi:hypothetical protein